jgi:hypothetical protein
MEQGEATDAVIGLGDSNLIRPRGGSTLSYRLLKSVSFRHRTDDVPALQQTSVTSHGAALASRVAPRSALIISSGESAICFAARLKKSLRRVKAI